MSLFIFLSSLELLIRSTIMILKHVCERWVVETLLILFQEPSEDEDSGSESGSSEETETEIASSKFSDSKFGISNFVKASIMMEAFSGKISPLPSIAIPKEIQYFFV